VKLDISGAANQRRSVKTPVGVLPQKYLQQAAPAVELSVHMVLTAVDLLHGQ